jgi:hypothetical protein
MFVPYLARSQTHAPQLDRVLKGVVMDRRAIVITGLESSQAIDEIVYHQLDQLKFDVDGQAPRLGLKGDECWGLVAVQANEPHQSLSTNS